MPCVLGVDPGLGGAYAVYDSDTHLLLGVFDMPVFNLTVGGKKARTLDLYKLSDGIRTVAQQFTVSQACVENVHTMPAQGLVTSGRLMEAYGAVKGIIAALTIPMELAQPSQWKKAMKLTSDKDVSRMRASQLFPSSAHLWSRVTDDGRAEAALLAVYGAAVATLIDCAERGWR